MKPVKKEKRKLDRAFNKLNRVSKRIGKKMVREADRRDRFSARIKKLAEKGTYDK